MPLHLIHDFIINNLIEDGDFVGPVGGSAFGHIFGTGPAFEGFEVHWHHQFSAELKLLDFWLDAGGFVDGSSEGHAWCVGITWELVDVVEKAGTKGRDVITLG